MRETYVGRRAAPHRAPRRLQRVDEPEVGRLVVRVALDDAEEVLGASGGLGQRPQDFDIDGPRLVSKRLRPVLVAVLLEKVARVGGLGELEQRKRLVE